VGDKRVQRPGGAVHPTYLVRREPGQESGMTRKGREYTKGQSSPPTHVLGKTARSQTRHRKILLKGNVRGCEIKNHS